MNAVEAAPAPPLRLLRELPICLALLAIILVAYWGVWNFDFVYFDDPGYVKDNLNVKWGLPLFTDFKLFKEGVSWAFTAFVQSNWHPLTWLSHMLDVQLYGLEAGGHHVTNIIFHVSNTLLLFWLLRYLTGRSWQSAAVAALFAVHPMHVESVVWVAERKDVLSTFFGLLTLIAYVRYARKADLANDSLVMLGVLSVFTWLMTLLCFNSFHSGHPETFAASLLWLYVPIFGGIAVYAVMNGRYNLLVYCAVFLLFVVGLLAKPMLVTLPCLCLLLDFWPLGRFGAAREAAPPQPAPVDRQSAPRRKAKRNQRLPVRRPTRPAEGGEEQSLVKRALLLVLEKVPLLALSVASAIITPYAQGHGGSVASTSELPISFRIQNSLQSYAGYIGRMFWPGKMMSLHLLVSDEMGRPYVEPRMVVMSVIVLSLLTAVAIAAFIYGRRYVTFGWLWYVGTLVPVIGFIQVGEQAMADRYTYIPYIGLFVAIVWATGELLEKFASRWRMLPWAVTLAMVVILGSWISWTNYQIQTWCDVQTHLRHALDVEPNNWNMLNNYGVWLWKQAQEHDASAAKAEAEGDVDAAKEHHLKSVEFKENARAQWKHGIDSRPTATDIHSNLGYAYSEANDLDKAEWHLNRAVDLKPISPRPRNNLGRVLLRRSQQLEADARAAEAKGKTDPAEAAKVPELKSQAKAKLDLAIGQFEEAVKLDDTLLEARLNLGEVYLSLNELDKAEAQYRAIVHLCGTSEKDPETLNNYSQGYFCLARIALVRKNSDEVVENLEKSLSLNPKNIAAMRVLANQRFQRGEYPEGEKCLWPLLAQQPAAMRAADGSTAFPRRNEATQFSGQFQSAGKTKEAVRAWNFFGWAFATEPHLLDPKAAVDIAQHVVAMTQQRDPLSLDTLAAAKAAKGQYGEAIQIAHAAINLANSLGNKPLAEAISQRLASYQQQTPYRCKTDGSDRP